MWKPAHSRFVVHNPAQGVMHTWALQMMLTPFVRIPMLACLFCQAMVIMAKDANIAVAALPVDL